MPDEIFRRAKKENEKIEKHIRILREKETVVEAKRTVESINGQVEKVSELMALSEKQVEEAEKGIAVVEGIVAIYIEAETDANIIVALNETEKFDGVLEELLALVAELKTLYEINVVKTPSQIPEAMGLVEETMNEIQVAGSEKTNIRKYINEIKKADTVETARKSFDEVNLIAEQEASDRMRVKKS